jgi:hypothetical protein
MLRTHQNEGILSRNSLKVNVKISLLQAVEAHRVARG